jgi:glucose/arabinose dehydrogenase
VYASGVPNAATFAFDTRGRLWVAAAGLQTHAHDGVYVVARAGARAVKVISGLKDPLGLAWLHGTLYVASVGRVDAYSDLRGTHFARHRLVLDGPARGAENNNLVVAPDGRLVMGITATCDHCTTAAKWSGAIVSFRPDGRDLRLYAGRIRAPVGLAYVPGTNELLATLDQRDDLGARTPGDWVAVVRSGQDWRFPGCYGQGGAACRGVPQPLAVLDAHAAVGGVAVLGREAIVAEWQAGKVLRLPVAGGSATTFLTGIKNPLAVTVAPDRSLLVGDWATGRIYLIRPVTA